MTSQLLQKVRKILNLNIIFIIIKNILMASTRIYDYIITTKMLYYSFTMELFKIKYIYIRYIY